MSGGRLQIVFAVDSGAAVRRWLLELRVERPPVGADTSVAQATVSPGFPAISFGVRNLLKSWESEKLPEVLTYARHGHRRLSALSICGRCRPPQTGGACPTAPDVDCIAPWDMIPEKIGRKCALEFTPVPKFAEQTSHGFARVRVQNLMLHKEIRPLGEFLRFPESTRQPFPELVRYEVMQEPVAHLPSAWVVRTAHHLRGALRGSVIVELKLYRFRPDFGGP